MSEYMFNQISETHARKMARWLLAGLFVLRLLYLFPFTAEFDLAADESYYWDWGRRPDWGYYSKPPMIGWLMGLVGWLSSNSEFAIRLAALGFGTVSLALIHAQPVTMQHWVDMRPRSLAAGLICWQISHWQRHM